MDINKLNNISEKEINFITINQYTRNLINEDYGKLVDIGEGKIINDILDSVETILSRFMFEFNDSNMRTEICGIVTNYLEPIKSDNNIQDFSIVMDESNNTPKIIDQNDAIIDIMLKLNNDTVKGYRMTMKNK